MSTIKIFNMDDCTWVAAANLEDAWKAFAEFYGYDISTPAGIEEARRDNQGYEPEELTDEDLERLQFVDDVGEPTPETTRTFREQLDAMKAGNPNQFPCFFATTEC